ncbi:MAG: hypothetical protein RLZ79_2125, partial [Pseudomonadota bacterium]
MSESPEQAATASPELESLREELAVTRALVEQLKDEKLRVFAELDNIRKRAQ